MFSVCRRYDEGRFAVVVALRVRSAMLFCRLTTYDLEYTWFSLCVGGLLGKTDETN